MDNGLRLTAAFALALAGLGLLALAVPDGAEGAIVLQLDPQHALRAMDLLGMLLIAGGTALTWGVGLAWQRRNAVALGLRPGSRAPEDAAAERYGR